MEPDRTPFRRLRDEIETHPGTRARREWDALLIVHAIYFENHNEALSMINAIERNQDGIALVMASNMGDPAPRERLFRELIRRIHNYVAGVVTYTDHTRNLMRSYEGTPTYDEYLVRVKALTASGLAPFVSKLRNFVLHYRLPAIGVQVSQKGEDELTFLCFLNRDKALLFKGWPASARTFLAGSEPFVPLGPVLIAYAGLLEDLYRWLYDQFTLLHGADIEAVNLLITQLPYIGPDGQMRGPIDPSS